MQQQVVLDTFRIILKGLDQHQTTSNELHKFIGVSSTLCSVMIAVGLGSTNLLVPTINCLHEEGGRQCSKDISMNLVLEANALLYQSSNSSKNAASGSSLLPEKTNFTPPAFQNPPPNCQELGFFDPKL
jgi:hypothetical protein